MHTVFVGHNWAEDHHGIHLENNDGRKLQTCRLDDGINGVHRLQGVLAELAGDPTEVLIATETDRGLFIAAGYAVIAINPMSTARHRERHSTPGAKSDRGNAQVLAEVARLDGHNHRHELLSRQRWRTRIEPVKQRRVSATGGFARPRRGCGSGS